MTPITATIITFNEEDRIVEAMASLSCADEILVVDSGSTDRTREIAAARGARVINLPWQGYSAQKNFAAANAKHDWILSLDADERLSIDLSDDVMKWKATPHSPVAAAASMPRKAFYMGRWIHHSGWYPDRKVRLYDRRHARWEGDFVHEGLNVDGPVQSFHGDLLHFPYRNAQDHKDRIDRYTKLAAEAARRNGSRPNPLRLLLAPPVSFAKTYFLRAGFLDGWQGLAIAYMGARYVFLRDLRILR